MFKLNIKDWRIRENRIGKESQYELVVDCELEPTNRSVQISTVVTGDDEALDIYTDICYVINAGNNAVENPE